MFDVFGLFFGDIDAVAVIPLFAAVAASTKAEFK